MVIEAPKRTLCVVGGVRVLREHCQPKLNPQRWNGKQTHAQIQTTTPRRTAYAPKASILVYKQHD
jgi:hypothetical protein